MKFNKRTLDFISGVDPLKLLKDNPQDITNPFAIICPHAGYVFSGEVAASVFNTIDPDKEYDNVFILSTSHTANYVGSAIIDEDYDTPYGTMPLNKNIKLQKDIFHVSPQYFLNDHTVEVILPFVQNKIKYKIFNLKHSSPPIVSYHNKFPLFAY